MDSRRPVPVKPIGILAGMLRRTTAWIPHRKAPGIRFKPKLPQANATAKSMPKHPSKSAPNSHGRPAVPCLSRAWRSPADRHRLATGPTRTACGTKRAEKAAGGRSKRPPSEKDAWLAGSTGDWVHVRLDEDNATTCAAECNDRYGKDGTASLKPRFNFRGIAVTNQKRSVGTAIGSPAHIQRAGIQRGRQGGAAAPEHMGRAGQRGRLWTPLSNSTTRTIIAMGDPMDSCLCVVRSEDGGQTWERMSLRGAMAAKACLSNHKAGEAAFAASNGNLAAAQETPSGCCRAGVPLAGVPEHGPGPRTGRSFPTTVAPRRRYHDRRVFYGFRRRFSRHHLGRGLGGQTGPKGPRRSDPRRRRDVDARRRRPRARVRFIGPLPAWAAAASSSHLWAHPGGIDLSEDGGIPGGTFRTAPFTRRALVLKEGCSGSPDKGKSATSAVKNWGGKPQATGRRATNRVTSAGPW